jgi:cobyrinic acid a,c-diamide synthase
MSVPRLLVAGLRGGSGKTLVSLGLAAAWREQGHTVAPFKKGPDYIDASWLTVAAGRPCRNLDLFFFSPATALESFRTATADVDVAVIEGNRGLYDGMDPEGTYSSGELAKLLRSPVLLSLDATKITRTAAALVLGCQTLDPDVSLAGVVLNRCAGARHERVLRQSIEGICGIPVLGAIPKLPHDLFPERHLGLVPPQETEEAEDPLERVREVAESYLDLERIMEVAGEARSLDAPHHRLQAPSPPWQTSGNGNGVVARVTTSSKGAEPTPGGGDSPPAPGQARIGVFQDAAFQFYYPENLEALEREGGVLVEISPLDDSHLPDVDALYLGGGFPETLALGLSENAAFMASVREAAQEGMPVYAECGGAVYLGERLRYEGRDYPLTGVLPVEFGFQARPRGHGYSVLEVVEESPFYSRGETLRGHEFHYTFLSSPEPDDLTFVFRVHRGYGFDGRHDGILRRNVLALYTHVHALGAEGWAPSLLAAALRFKSSPGAAP